MVRIPTNRVPTHPGEMLLEEFLKPLGLTQRKVAEAGRTIERLGSLDRTDGWCRHRFGRGTRRQDPPADPCRQSRQRRGPPAMGYPVHHRSKSRPTQSTTRRDRGHRRNPRRSSTTGRNRTSHRSTVHLVDPRGADTGTPPRNCTPRSKNRSLPKPFSLPRPS